MGIMVIYSLVNYLLKVKSLKSKSDIFLRKLRKLSLASFSKFAIFEDLNM